MNPQNLSFFIWSVADLLRGDYRQSERGRVISPFTVLRRLDGVLGPTKGAVLAEMQEQRRAEVKAEPIRLRQAVRHFYNNSPLDLKRLLGEQDRIRR